MSRKLKIGIIGMGTIGNVHADAYRTGGDAELVALSDINAKALAAGGDRLGVKARFADYRDLLKTDVEAVIVSVGNSLHREVAVAALRAGKHVFLEKPMALNVREAVDIVRVAGRQKRKKVLQMGMVWRQNPAAKVVREYVEQGLFGEIYHLRAVMIRRRGIPGLGRWFTTKALSGGGPLIDLGVHWFDIALWMSGCWQPTSVSAQTYAKFGPRMRNYRYVGMWAGPPCYNGVCDVEDYAAGLVRFGARATLAFEIAWAANAHDEAYVDIMGTKGGARLFDGKPLEILTEHGCRPATLAPQFDTNVNMYEEQARSFVAACRGEAAPAATGADGLTVMQLIDAVYASSAAHREVAIRALR